MKKLGQKLSIRFIPLLSELVTKWCNVKLSTERIGLRLDWPVDPECERCHSNTRFDQSSFWLSVFNSLSLITSLKIQPSPMIGQFGVLPTDYMVPSYFADFVAFLTLLARRQMLLNWKHSHPPSHASGFSLHQPSTWATFHMYKLCIFLICLIKPFHSS